MSFNSDWLKQALELQEMATQIAISRDVQAESWWKSVDQLMEMARQSPRWVEELMEMTKNLQNQTNQRQQSNRQEQIRTQRYRRPPNPRNPDGHQNPSEQSQRPVGSKNTHPQRETVQPPRKHVEEEPVEDPVVRMDESRRYIIVTSYIPGVRSTRDVSVKLKSDTLFIAAQTYSVANGGSRTGQEQSGVVKPTAGKDKNNGGPVSYRKIVQLPAEAEIGKASANYRDGYLTVRLVKKDPEQSDIPVRFG